MRIFESTLGTFCMIHVRKKEKSIDFYIIDRLQNQNHIYIFGNEIPHSGAPAGGEGGEGRGGGAPRLPTNRKRAKPQTKSISPQTLRYFFLLKSRQAADTLVNSAVRLARGGNFLFAKKL